VLISNRVHEFSPEVGSIVVEISPILSNVLFSQLWSL